MSPSEIRLVEDRRKLQIAWPDGTRSCLDASYLRAHCRSSRAVRSALDGAALSDDLRITGLHLIGNYALNLAFSDGQDRGIYPWSYLRRLSGDAPADPSWPRHES